LVIGKGDMDFRSILKALKEINYKGFITIELYPYQDNPIGAGKESLERLKKLLREI